MKKILAFVSKIACVSFAPLCTVGAVFQDVNTNEQEIPTEDPKLWSFLNIEDDGHGNVVLKGFKETVSFNDINETKEKVLIIPPNVTEIASMAFPYVFDGVVVKNVEAVDFSQATNLKRIGNCAFYWNKGLESRTLAPSDIDLSKNTKLESIGDQAFAFSGFDGVVKFPESLTKIGNNAFESCEGLSGELNFPQNLVSVGDYAFKNCTNISAVNALADKTGYIPDWMYDYSLALKNVGTRQKSTKPVCNVEVINNSIDTWKYVLFNRLSLSDSMFDVKPIGLTDIDCFAIDEKRNSITGFNGTKINDCRVFQLPNQIAKGKDLTTVESRAFLGSQAKYDQDIQGCLWPQTSNFFPIIFDEETKIAKIQDNAFQFAGNLKGTLTLPSTLTYLGHSAFESCVCLEKIDFSQIQGDLEVGTRAFSGCTKIRHVVLTPKIKPYTSEEYITKFFYTNVSLYWIDMSTFGEDPPNGWEECFSFVDMYKYGYDYYPRLLLLPQDACMDDEEEDYEWPAFLRANCYDYKEHPNLHIVIMENLENVLERKMLLIDGDHIVRDIADRDDPAWLTTANITLPEDIKIIDRNVFKDMFTSDDASVKYLLRLNDGLQRIDDNAFENCNALIFDFLYPSSLTWIGDNAFAGCTNMYQNFYLPPKLRHLGSSPWPKGVLMSCPELRIPKTLEYAGGMAFGDLKIYAQQTAFARNPTIVIPPSLQTTTSVKDGEYEHCGPFAGICNYLLLQDSMDTKDIFNIDISAFGSQKPDGWDPYTLWIKPTTPAGKIYVKDNKALTYWNNQVSQRHIFLSEGWQFEVKQ